MNPNQLTTLLVFLLDVHRRGLDHCPIGPVRPIGRSKRSHDCDHRHCPNDHEGYGPVRLVSPACTNVMRSPRLQILRIERFGG